MHSTVTCSTFLCLLTVYQPHIFDLSLKLKYIILSCLSGLWRGAVYSSINNEICPWNWHKIAQNNAAGKWWGKGL